MPRYLLVMFLTLFALHVPAGEQTGEQPPAFKALYVVKKGPFELGRSSRELAYGTDGEPVFISNSDTTGLAGLFVSEHIRQTTQMKQDGPRVVPLEYSYQRKGRNDDSISQQFDWDKGYVTSQVNEAVYRYPLPRDALDQSGYQVALMVDLAMGGREFSYHVAGKRKIRTYEIKYVGDEPIETVLGKLNTVVIQRKDERTTTMWCAYDLHFLPVKIQHEEKGVVFTAYLESVEGLTVP